MKQNNPKQSENQPLLFVSTILLSLVGSSLGLVLFAAAALFFEQTKQLVIEVTNISSMDGLSAFYFMLLAALCLLSLIGVLKMKKYQKAGFFFYLGAQLALLFLPVIWLNWNAFSVTNTIFISLFSLIYLSFYKRMA